MHQTRVFTDKSITSQKCDHPDIPIITPDTAILHVTRDKDDDYVYIDMVGKNRFIMDVTSDTVYIKK